MKVKRTLALWLLSAMFAVCSFFGMVSLNNKEVHAEATTPTWQQTLIANSNDGMIAFPTPIDNWKTSSSVISFDSDKPSVMITLLYSNMENYSHRATEKNSFSGTLVEASPSNYYHYEINASAFDVKGGGEYTGQETVYGFSNRGTEEFKIANLQVSGATYEMPIKAVTISDLKENGKYVGDTLSLNGANTVYTYNSLLKSANNSVIFNFKFVANQWAVDDDGIQLGFMGKWASEGGLWLRPDKIRIMKASGYVETITLAPNATYDIEYGRLAKMNGETFTGKFYFYVKIDGKMLGSYETTQDSMLAKHNNATTDDLAQPCIWIQRKTGLANNMLTDPTTYERPEKLLNVSNLKLNGSAVGEEISSNGSNAKYDYDASLQSANKSLVFQFKFTPANPWTAEGDGFQMNLMGAWANEGGIWIRPDTIYLLGGGVGGGAKSVASPLTTVGTTYLIEYGRLAMTVNGQFSGHYYFYLKIDGVLLLDYIGEKESVETKNKVTLDVAQIWIQRKDTINHTISNALVIDYETPADAVSVGDLSHGDSPVGDTLDFNDGPQYSYNPNLKTANHSLIFKFKLTTVNWVNNGDGGDGFQMGMFNAWPDANGGGLWIRPDAVRIMANGDYVVGAALANDTTYNVEWGRLAIIENSVFTNKYYVYVKIDGELWIDCVVEGSAIGTSNLEQTQLWIQRKVDYQSIMRDIDYAEITHETPADAVSIGDLSHGDSPVGDTLDFNDGPQYSYDSSFKTANHSLIFKFKLTTVNWVNNGDGGDGFQMGMFNAWPDANGGGLWIRPDAVRIMANGDYVVGAALANDTTYDVEWGRLAILRDGVFANKYYVYVKIDGELWIDCEVEGSAIGASNLEQTQLWIQRKVDYQSIMRDIDYAETMYETPADAVSVGDLSHGGSPVGDTLDFNDAPPYTYDSSFKTANHSLIFKFKLTTVNWVNNGDGGDGFQMGMFNAWPDANGGGLWIRPDAVRIMANGDYVVGAALANDTTYDVEWGRLAILKGGVFTNKYYVYVKIDGELWIDCEVEGSAIGTSNLEQTQLWIQRKVGYQSIMRDIDYAEAIYETPDEIGVSDLLYDGQSAEFYTMDRDRQFTIGKDLTATNHSLVFRFMYNAITWTDNDNHGAQIRFLNNWDNTPGFVWIRPDKAYIFNASGGFVGSSSAISAGVHSVEVGRLAKINGETGDVINYLVYISIDGVRVIEQEFEASDLSAILGSDEIFITGSVGNEVYDLNYVPQQPIVKTHETPANAISVGDLKENGNLVGDELSLNNKNNAILTYDSSFKTANNSVIFKFKFVTNQWAVDGDGIQIGLLGKWAMEGGLWLRPDRVRIIKDSGYVESITLAPNATYDIEYGRLAILENGVYTGSFYFYVKIDGELIATYETTQESMLTYNKATTADLAQPNVWIQRKEGLANVIRDTDYVTFTYETPDVVDVSDLLYNGLPFGGAYTLATTRFTIGKELTATNHSLTLRFVFDPKTWDESGSPQIHFIDSYSETGFAWLKPNNTYIFRADGQYTSAGYTISHALHLVEVGRLAKISDADGSVMGYKFFVKVDGVTVVEYELASSEFASVSNLQDILNSKTIFITTDVGNQIYDVDYFPQMENAGDLYLVPWKLSASGIAFTASIESKIYNFRNITESGIIVVPTKNVTGNITLESTYENLIVIPASVSENAGLTLLKAGVLGILDGNICKDYTAVAYVKYAGADGGVVVAYSKPATTNLYEQISKAESVPAEVSAKLSKALAVNIDLATSAVVGASISGAIGDNTLTLTGSSASYSCYMINGQEVLAGETIVLGYSTYTASLNANKITLTKVATETVFGVSEHYTVLNDHYPEYLTPENIGSAMDELGLTSYRFDISLKDLFTVKEGEELVLRADAYQKINALLSQMEEQGKTDSLAVLWYIQPYGHDYRWDGASNNVGSEKVIDFRSDWYTRYLDLNEEAVRQVALLFPQVVNFEVWNEPELFDQMVGWNGSALTRLTPAQKAQFLTDIMYRVNRALKSVNSDIILTSPSLCTFQRVYNEVDCTTDEFLRCIYEAIADDIAPTGCEQDTKADNYFDVVNIHPYVGVGNTTDSNWETWLETIHQISVENGDANTPIWITEFGFNTNGLTNSEINSKASILSSKISLIKNTDYITRVYFYTAIDDSTAEQKWGLFAWDNGLEIKATGEAVKEALK